MNGLVECVAIHFTVSQGFDHMDIRFLRERGRGGEETSSFCSIGYDTMGTIVSQVRLERWTWIRTYPCTPDLRWQDRQRRKNRDLTLARYTR